MNSAMIRAATFLYPRLLLACATNTAERQEFDANAALGYLKSLEGKWVVQGGDEGPIGWEFDVTARGSVVREFLKVGTETEMSTVYHIEDGRLMGRHYCQLMNQPQIETVLSDSEGDLHFICDGQVSNIDSHAELHMHGVHFQKTGKRLRIWMDMSRDGKIAFETSYTMMRLEDVESQAGR